MQEMGIAEGSTGQKSSVKTFKLFSLVAPLGMGLVYVAQHLPVAFDAGSER